MKKILGSMLIAIALATPMTSPASAAIHSNVPQDVEKFAEQDGLAEAKKLLSLSPHDVGFSSSEEVNELTLGPGLQTYSLDVEKFEKSRSNSLLSVIKPLQEWEFILQKDGQAITSLIVRKDNGQFSLERVGGNSSNFQATWKKFDAYTDSKAEPTLLVDRNVRYFIGTLNNREVAIPDLSGNRFVKLTNVDSEHVSSASEIFKALKEDITESRKNQTASEPQFGSSGTLSQQENPNPPRSTSILIAIGIICLLGIGIYSRRHKKG